MYLGETRP
jgi:hypothetical protein